MTAEGREQSVWQSSANDHYRRTIDCQHRELEPPLCGTADLVPSVRFWTI